MHIVGPGGAGKTTAGRIVAMLLEWDFIDLDERLLSKYGSIANLIQEHDYLHYARKNVALYEEIKNAMLRPSVFVLSSGFMTYPETIGAPYLERRRRIENNAMTVLLLPSFDVEECIACLVDRQLQRPYLSTCRADEERKIRRRLPQFLALNCRQFHSGGMVAETALTLTSFIKSQTQSTLSLG